MTFYQARAISKTGLHVRRASWSADKWFMIWRGTWFCFTGGNPPVPVKASDYSTDDLLATDWTTVPAALAACPIDPGTGSTGGSPPIPGQGGFPNDPTPPLLGGSGVPTGGGSTTLPPPDPGTSVSVTFLGITENPSDSFVGVMLDRTVTLQPAGSNFWTASFMSGNAPSDPPDSITWNVQASRSGSAWSVTLNQSEGGGGFTTPGSPSFKPGDTIPNSITSGAEFYGGTATIHGG